MGVTAQQTRQTEHPVTGVPRPSIIPSPDTLHAFHHVGVTSHGPLDGHNNGADLRCNSWFGNEITQKCDQSGQRDSSEQREGIAGRTRRRGGVADAGGCAAASIQGVLIKCPSPKTTRETFVIFINDTFLSSWYATTSCDDFASLR